MDLSQGTKYDGGKTRYDLITPEATEGLAKVLTFGANKYADRNWEKGIKFSRVLRALKSHILEWEKHGMPDDETGLSHLHHAAANIMFLQTYEARGMVDFNDIPGQVNLHAAPEVSKADLHMIRYSAGEQKITGVNPSSIEPEVALAIAAFDNPREDWTRKSAETAAQFGVKSLDPLLDRDRI